MSNPVELTGRHRALLRAVAAGRCELTASREPDLFVDGLCCCDQMSARQLVHSHLVEAATDGSAGPRVTALLTSDGEALLAA